MNGFGTDTIAWRDRVVTHRLEAFPALERTTHRGQSVRAYRDRWTSLFEMFADAVETDPDREFVVFPESGTRRTYRDVAERVQALAGGLLDEGLSPGDRVGLVADSRPEFVEAVLAGARLGVVVVPLNTGHSSTELCEMLDDADPDLVLVGPEYLDKLEGSAYGLPNPTTRVLGSETAGGSYETLLRDADEGIGVDRPTEDDHCVVVYTSGTTGRPKGVPIDHFHCTNATLNNVAVHGLEDGLTNLVPSALFHVTGLVCGLFATIAVDGTAVVLRDYDSGRFLRLIESEGVNYCMGVPTHIILAAEEVAKTEYDVSTFDKFAYGGAPMPGEALPTIREAFPDVDLYHSYGKTENFAGIASMLPDRHVDDNPESVGLPTPVVRFAVVDEDRNRLPPGELGELAIYGPFVAERYLNPTGDADEEFDRGWHYTGDIGVVDEDGFVELRGRKGDMIIRGGKNVYPAEVEDALLANEDVLDAGVTSFPDDVLGERIFAVAVPREQRRVTEDALRRTCEEKLADYKVPDIFRIVDELPRNQNGKLQREELVPRPLRFGIKFGG